LRWWHGCGKWCDCYDKCRDDERECSDDYWDAGEGGIFSVALAQHIEEHVWGFTI
jgi:hypothetical protein